MTSVKVGRLGKGGNGNDKKIRNRVDGREKSSVSGNITTEQGSIFHIASLNAQSAQLKKFKEIESVIFTCHFSAELLSRFSKRVYRLKFHRILFQIRIKLRNIQNTEYRIQIIMCFIGNSKKNNFHMKDLVI